MPKKKAGSIRTPLFPSGLLGDDLVDKLKHYLGVFGVGEDGTGGDDVAVYDGLKVFGKLVEFFGGQVAEHGLEVCVGHFVFSSHSGLGIS